MKKKTDKQRLFEVMGRLDKTFKPKLNEEETRDWGDEKVSPEMYDELMWDKQNLEKAMGDAFKTPDDYELENSINVGDKIELKNGEVIDIIDIMPDQKMVKVKFYPVGRDEPLSITWSFKQFDSIVGNNKLKEDYEEPTDPDVGHYEYLKKSNQLKSFDDDSVVDDGVVDENEDDISVEPQEHGPEGPNYKAKLECIVDKSQKIYEGLPEGEIPHWVQDKITLAEDYLKSIYSWMHGEEEEKEGDIEGAEREMDSEEGKELTEGQEGFERKIAFEVYSPEGEFLGETDPMDEQAQWFETKDEVFSTPEGQKFLKDNNLTLEQVGRMKRDRIYFMDGKELEWGYYSPSQSQELYDSQTNTWYNRSGQQMRDPSEYERYSDGTNQWGERYDDDYE